MISRVRFAGRLVDAARRPMAGETLVLQMLPLTEDWTAIGEATTNAGGRFKGDAEADQLTDTRVAPRFRLVTSNNDVLLSGEPVMKLTRGTLNVDYETVVFSVHGGDTRLDPGTAEEISRLKTKLLSAEIELEDLKARLAAAKSALAEVEQERDGLQVELDQIRMADETSPLITDLATKVASSLGNATPDIAGGGFQLGEATVRLKGFLTDGGNRFKPMDVAEASGLKAGGASEIEFSLRAPTTDADVGLLMPDLLGLTASGARKALRPFGADIQVVEIPGTPVGAIIKQHPEPGDALASGDTVRLQVAVQAVAT